MDLKLTKKVAIILASSDGLGKASALEFASEGAQVIISSRNESKLKTVANEIRQTTNGKVDFFPADVSKKEDIEALVRTTAEKFGSIDILVNNAGGPPAGTLKILRMKIGNSPLSFIYSAIFDQFEKFCLICKSKKVAGLLISPHLLSNNP